MVLSAATTSTEYFGHAPFRYKLVNTTKSNRDEIWIVTSYFRDEETDDMTCHQVQLLSQGDRAKIQTLGRLTASGVHMFKLMLYSLPQNGRLILVLAVLSIILGQFASLYNGVRYEAVL